jgi:hypothetical protein
MTPRTKFKAGVLAVCWLALTPAQADRFLLATFNHGEQLQGQGAMP